jgi:hypothetical protein
MEKKISLETLLGNFAYHVQTISTEKAPGKVRCSCVPDLPCVDIVITPCQNATLDNDSKSCDIWDQCIVNGVNVGNRCGAISAYTKLVAPFLAKYLGDNQEFDCQVYSLTHDWHDIERAKLHKTVGL